MTDIVDESGEVTPSMWAYLEARTEITKLRSELASAKAAFAELTLEVYRREDAYRSVIDGMTEWLTETRDFLAPHGEPAADDFDRALDQLNELKSSALSTLGSLPPRGQDLPSGQSATPPAPQSTASDSPERS